MIYSLNKPLKAHQKTIPIRRFKWPIRGFNFHRIAKIYFTEHLKELRITFVQNRNICTRQPTTMAKNENCGMLLALSVPLVCFYSINLSFEKFIMQLVNHGNYVHRISNCINQIHKSNIVSAWMKSSFFSFPWPVFAPDPCWISWSLLPNSARFLEFPCDHPWAQVLCCSLT